MQTRKILLTSFTLSLGVAVFADDVGVGNGLGARYANDAWPGFDTRDENTSPEKKNPRWFSWINGPKMSDAAAQFAWARELEDAGSASRARRAYDALVREWPTSAEAPEAQLRIAKLNVLDLDYEEGFKEYRYLLDFYSTSCDFSAVAREMYKLAEIMREEGKTILFFNFRNSADVRRAYESLVLRAPGAAFVPKAMLAIAALREDEGHLQEAVAVYENLRNLHPESEEAVEAACREAVTRMKIVREHGYNRNRMSDTRSFLRRIADGGKLPDDRKEELTRFIAETDAMLEDEAWKSARFYDSRTRTRRSAINGYSAYLKDHPEGVHAEEARRRIAELEKGGELK